MHIAGSSKVRDKDGVWGTVVSESLPLPSNAAQVVVQTERGQQVLVPTDILIQQPDGSYYLPLRLAELEHSGSEHDGHQRKRCSERSHQHGCQAVDATLVHRGRHIQTLFLNQVPVVREHHDAIARSDAEQCDEADQRGDAQRAAPQPHGGDAASNPIRHAG